MKNRVLLITVSLLPLMALANITTDVGKLRAKIKETSEEFRVVCRGHNKYSYRVGSDSTRYCSYLEAEVDKLIKELERITDNYEHN